MDRSVRLRPRLVAAATTFALALALLAAAPSTRVAADAAGPDGRAVAPEALEQRAQHPQPRAPASPGPAADALPDEAADIAEAVADRARNQDPQRFGGVWFEGDRMVVGATADAQGLANRAARAVGAQADAVTVDFSLAELEATHDELHAVADELDARGLEWHAFALRLADNRVVVNAPSPTGALEDALAELLSRPETVEVEAGHGYEPACTRTNCVSGPIRAGLEVWMPNSGGACTMAFSATLPGVGEGILTAGHCVSSWEQVAHNNFWFGQARQTHFYNGSSADAVFITKFAGWPTATNWVYRNAWNPSFQITSIGNGGWQGQHVCFSGRTTNGEVCGNITATGVTINYGSVILYNQNIFSGCAQPGDSGSPVYTLGGTAQGILSGGSTNPWGGCGNDVIYTPIPAAQAATGATVKTSP